MDNNECMPSDELSPHVCKSHGLRVCEMQIGGRLQPSGVRPPLNCFLHEIVPPGKPSQEFHFELVDFANRNIDLTSSSPQSPEKTASGYYVVEYRIRVYFTLQF